MRDKTHLTQNQIAGRPGWTKAAVALALPEPDSHLGKEYRNAPLYKIERVEAVEAWGNMVLLNEHATFQEEMKKAIRDERRKRREAKSANRLATLPVPDLADAEILRNYDDKERTQQELVRVSLAFSGSSARRSKALYSELEKLGGFGPIAAYLMRTQKASSRAKEYRRDFADLSYSRKNDAMGVLCSLLARQTVLKWGWGIDDSVGPWLSDVLYVELRPWAANKRQVSFHSTTRFSGPDYDGEWDGACASESRILSFAAVVLAAFNRPSNGPQKLK